MIYIELWKEDYICLPPESSPGKVEQWNVIIQARYASGAGDITLEKFIQNVVDDIRKLLQEKKEDLFLEIQHQKGGEA